MVTNRFGKAVCQVTGRILGITPEEEALAIAEFRRMRAEAEAQPGYAWDNGGRQFSLTDAGGKITIKPL